jgi:orotidine-5'-phosphate decarboxylase
MTVTPKNPVFCAIDTTDLEAAADLAASIAGHVGGIKLGKEFFTSHGPQGVRRLTAGGLPLFLDLKFHDIPNTVAGAVRAATTAVSPYMMTIHAAGGPAMLRAAAEAAGEASAKAGVPRPLLLGVTVLTSLDEGDLRAIGVPGSLSDQVVRLAELSRDCELDGVICSPHEITALRQRLGGGFKLVVPGIRPAGSGAGDQKRVMTPREALDLGADYLVIGRPITRAADPAQAAAAIAAGIA